MSEFWLRQPLSSSSSWAQGGHGSACRGHELSVSEFTVGISAWGCTEGFSTCRGLAVPAAWTGIPQKRHVVRSWSWLSADVLRQNCAPGGCPCPGICLQCTGSPAVLEEGHGRGKVPAGKGVEQGRDPADWQLPSGEGTGQRWGQGRMCLTQFLIVHFCPEHLCTTSRSPKLASLDISTSRHLPVSRLIMGPPCGEGNRVSMGAHGSPPGVWVMASSCGHCMPPETQGCPSSLPGPGTRFPWNYTP